MKNLYLNISIVLMLILFLSACTAEEKCEYVAIQENEESVICNLKSFNASLNFDPVTRNGGPTVSVNDDDLKIIEADIIGAIIGAGKGLEYAENQNLNQDEAITVIIASAITYGVARSHAAYVNNLHDPGHATAFCIPSPIKDYSDDINILREDIESLSVSEKIKTNFWMNISDDIIGQNFPNAELVGKKHNSILSIINTENTNEDYESAMTNYTDIESAYLLSRFHLNAFAQSMKNLFYYMPSYYSESLTTDSKINDVSRLFLEAINTKDRTVNDIEYIVSNYFAKVKSAKDLSYLEKETLYLSFGVGIYSLSYWFSVKS